MRNVSQYFWEPVNKRSNKMAYVGSLRVNQSDMASRFIVGRIELPIRRNCSVANAKLTVLNYNTTTCKFSEDGGTISINAEALPTNVSVKYSKKIIMHGA